MQNGNNIEHGYFVWKSVSWKAHIYTNTHITNAKKHIIHKFTWIPLAAYWNTCLYTKSKIQKNKSKSMKNDLFTFECHFLEYQQVVLFVYVFFSNPQISESLSMMYATWKINKIWAQKTCLRMVLSRWKTMLGMWPETITACIWILLHKDKMRHNNIQYELKSWG